MMPLFPVARSLPTVVARLPSSHSSYSYNRLILRAERHDDSPARPPKARPWPLAKPPHARCTQSRHPRLGRLPVRRAPPPGPPPPVAASTSAPMSGPSPPWRASARTRPTSWVLRAPTARLVGEHALAAASSAATISIDGIATAAAVIEPWAAAAAGASVPAWSALRDSDPSSLAAMSSWFGSLRLFVG